ncbi:MAG: N-acetylglutamate synthase, partial [Lautropia sp.]|nr:N-acetylglutamate synthase [Lautropia sp.]
MTTPDSAPSFAEIPAVPAEVSQQQFVAWLRQVAPYIHKFVGQTFVVGIPGEVLQSDARINALIQDLSLLHSIGISIVIVNGCRPQINDQLRLRGREPQYHNGLRVTDKVAMECAKEAAGEIRYDMEALFSQGLPNTPMANAGIRVISGNFTLARPVGI